MKINTDDKRIPKRLAIFQCHDKDGIIDDYIPYLLRDLQENLEMLVVVVNGKLTQEGRLKLENLTPHVFTRADEGFDAAAWKEAMIEYLGWEKIAEFDELILLNDTFFGPFYPFKEVFTEMDQRAVDFWGLTAHAAKETHSEYCPNGYWPTHIQSYFIVIRKRMLSSHEFRQYWEKQPLFKSRDELINRNEVVFTKHFEDAGFTWAVLSDTRDLDGESLDGSAINHYAFNTYELLKNRNYPVIKRRNIGAPYSEHLYDTNGEQLRKCLNYIARNTSYDISLIYQNLLRIYNIADIHDNLHLNYVLSKDFCTRDISVRGRAAFVMHISYLDMLDDIKPFICNLPAHVDVILTTKPKENMVVLQRFFEPVLGDRLTILLAKDPGRDLSALLVTAKPFLKKYEYIGFCHDKRSHQGAPVTVGEGFQKLLLENLLGSSNYVKNVLNLFEEYPQMGLLVPPPPHHADYFWNMGNAWTCCFDATKQVADRLGLTVKIEHEKYPLSIGTAFWCRYDALSLLFEYPWVHKDFPMEPLPVDGTLNHALERIFPFVAQQQGYLTGWIMTNQYAELEVNNFHYMLYKSVQDTGGQFPRFNDFENFMCGNKVIPIGLKGALIIYIKKHLPKPFWGVARKIKHLLRW